LEPAGVADNRWRVEATRWPPLRLPRLGDERLARLVARGNSRAFAAVYDRYHQPLYRYCRSILRDDVDAQDALQSTFMRALAALKRDQRSAPLRPWLFRIAHNEAISVLRRRRRGEATVRDALPAIVSSAEDQAGERARLAMLMGDLAALPERARSALVMRELSGLSHDEIAIALETTPGAAKQAIFEARRGLAECAEGREMACADVCREMSDGDRRVLRGRRVRAHLRDCAACAAFASALEARQSELRALVPALPAAASAVVLSRAMEAGVGGAGGAGGAAAVGAAGKTIGVAVTSKGFATASLLATAAVSVSGVAAVVRLAPVHTGGGHARAARAARAEAVRHAGTHVRAHAGTSSSTYGVAVRPAASIVSAPTLGPARGGDRAGAYGRHVRFTSWHGHGHGRVFGRHRATAAAHDKFTGEEHGDSRGGGHGGGHGGWRVVGHHASIVPVVRHSALEGYAGEPAHHHHGAWRSAYRADHGYGHGHGHGRGHER
jgi:RNA polymerase sigma factor (sigma-70 family)